MSQGFELSGDGCVDVLIVGGGPAGASTALALVRQGQSVVVLESSRYGAVKVGETLPPEAQEPLTTLGVWERFLSDGHRPSLCNLSAWGGPRLESREHLWSPYGQGWHLDRGRFDAMLSAAARDAGATILEGARLEAVARVGGSWVAVVLREGERLQLRAHWLIDATGRSASLVRRLGGRRVRSDRLIGMTAFPPALHPYRPWPTRPGLSTFLQEGNMDNCDGFAKTWKIKTVNGHFEVVGHRIKIKKLTSGSFSVECLDNSNHVYSDATCNNGTLTGTDYTIDLTAGNPNRLDLQSETEPGSWTADDNLGLGGA